MTEQMMASRTLNGFRALNDHGHLDRLPAEETSQADVAREGARDGPTPLSIILNYRRGLFSFGPIGK